MKIDRTEIIKDRERVYFTLTVDGDSCEHQAYAPLKSEEFYKLFILKFMYPESAGTPKNIYYGGLEGFEKWIKDGCKIPATTKMVPVLDKEGNPTYDQAVVGEYNEDQPERVAKKVPWTQRHPIVEGVLKRSEISDGTKAELAALRKSDPKLMPIIDVLIGRRCPGF